MGDDLESSISTILCTTVRHPIEIFSQYLFTLYVTLGGGGLSEFHYLTKPIKWLVGFMRLPQEGMALSREDSGPTHSQVRDIQGKLS